MSKHIFDFVQGKSLAVYLITAFITIVFAAMMTGINIDTDPENMLPENQSDRVFHNQVEQRFQLHDAIVVGMVNRANPNGVYNPASLSKLHTISKYLLDHDGVIRADLMSLSEVDNISQSEMNSIRFEWMMKEAPLTAEQSIDVRHKVERLPMLMNTLVSGDGKAAAIYVPITSKDLSYSISRDIAAMTQHLSDDNANGDEFHITGLPVAEDTFGHEMFKQMAISAPLAGLMIFILMWYFFRNVRLITAPMIVAMVTVICTMGLLIGMGFTVHIMSSMIPIFLMPIAVVDSVHILSEFADRYHPNDDRVAQHNTIREVLSRLFKPMLFTSLTSAAGFASLMLTPIPPVQVFGGFVAFGILLAFIATMTFIPAYIVRMKPEHLRNLERLRSGSGAGSLLARSLRVLGQFAFRQRILIVGCSIVILVVSVWGVIQIQVNDNPVRWFKEQHRIRIADKVLNEHFAGTYDSFLVLEHHDPKSITTLRKQIHSQILQRYPVLDNALASLPETANASDLDEVIMTVDDLIFDGDAEDAAMLDPVMETLEQAQSELRYFQSPQAVALLENLQRMLNDSGLVGKTSALPDSIKVVNRELYSGEDADYMVPQSQAAIAQALLQYQSSHRPHDLWHSVTPDFNAASIWLQLKSGDNQDMTQVIALVDDYLKQNPLPEGVSSRWAGKTFINVVWQEAMVSGMFKSLLGAFVVVMLMMTLLFRSIYFGLLAMIPLTLTIICAYGLIGWIGKDYDMPIAVLSALSLGLSVDFAIHFIQRFRMISAASDSDDEIKSLMYEEPARAIARNAIVIGLGFTPLLFAPLTPYITVGVFMVLIMLVSGLSTLILLPALLQAKIGLNRDELRADYQLAEN